MPIKPVLLWTDALIFLLIITAGLLIWHARKSIYWRRVSYQLLRNRLALLSLLLIAIYSSIALLDSIHFRRAIPNDQQTIHYKAGLESVLDLLLHPLGEQYERTYSAPFALHLFIKQTFLEEGQKVRGYPKLQHVETTVSNPEQRAQDIKQSIITGAMWASIICIIILAALTIILAKHYQQRFGKTLTDIICQRTDYPWRFLSISVFVVFLLIAIVWQLAEGYHILGTDKVGHDVFYQTIKSIRTGLVIGTLTTLVMLPFAIALGIIAGYFKGWLDDMIQYLYTTLSAIPAVLLIAASILSLQVFIANRPDLLPTLAMRADARLLILCLVLGITSWTSLCRILRAETLKLRELDYVQAAKILGSSPPVVLRRHILPNVSHLILITVILDFSTLVLAEAVLTYVGVGVDPSTASWGNMINAARLELAREPAIWWPILAAFIFMFTFVLAINLFADGLRDALDPRMAANR